MSEDQAVKTEPRFTQMLQMHMNGGRKFSVLSYDVYRDGVKTKIVHNRRTSGSPKYLITDDVFICGDETFDNKAAGGIGLKEWLIAHSQEGG